MFPAENRSAFVRLESPNVFLAKTRLSARRSGRRLGRGMTHVMTIGLCLVAMLFSAPSWAQNGGSIEGQIAPGHDHDVTKATASIPELALEVAIRADGSFSFDRVRPGSHVLVVRIPTLGSAVERVVVEAGVTLELEIEVSPGSHFEEVAVTGEFRDSLDLASAVTSLSGEDLMRRVEGSLGETLSGEAGISSSFFGPGASRPIIRGFSGDRVRMLEDGLGSGDASDVSVDHAVTIDPLQAERIEVLRGPATLLYGSSAVGGVVNVIDDRIPSTRATSPIDGTVDLRFGSVSNEQVGSLTLNGGSGDWAWRANVIGREADDYDIPGFAVLEEGEHEEEEHEEEGHDDGDEHEEEEDPFGVVPNSNLESQGARVGVTRFFGDAGFLGVSASGFDTEYGIPGGHGHEEEGEHDDEHGDDDDDEHGDEDEHGEHEEEEDEHGEEIVRIDMQQRRLDLKGGLLKEFGIFKAAKLKIGLNDYEHAELEGDEIGTLFFNDYIEGRIELVQKERGPSRGSMGLQYSDRDLNAIGAEAFVPESTSERWALFTFQEIEKGSVSWQLGARFESQDSRAVGGPSVSHDGVSGSGGFVWTASDTWDVAASVSRSVKLPAPEELFANGPHIATRAFEIGDPNLKEEVGLGFDVSLRKTEGRLKGEFTLFRQAFDDFINQEFSGDVEDGLPVVRFVQQDAVFEGAELSAKLELLDRNGHHLHLRVVGDMVDAELDGGDNDGQSLARIPPASFGAGLHYHSERWNAMAEVRRVDDQTDVAPNETATDGYTFINASLGYRFIFQGRIIDLMLRGRNLTDEEARVHTSFLKNFAPLPGRDVSLSMRFWF